MNQIDARKSLLGAVVVTLYIFFGSSFLGLGGLAAYVVPSLLWSFSALFALCLFGLEGVRSWFNKPLVTMAALVGIFQIAILVFAGLFTGFGKSPYDFTFVGIAVNLASFVPLMIALELSRAFLIKNGTRRRAVVATLLAGLFFAFLSIPFVKFESLNTLPAAIEFLGSQFLPVLAESLLATYLAMIGGPITSLAYVGPLTIFEWMSPIIPNLPWEISALLNTLVPAVGFLALEQSVSPFALVRLGLKERKEMTLKFRRTQNRSSIGWIATIMVILILLWSASGPIGFRANVVVTGSMRPTLDVGDLIVVEKVSSGAIQPGNMIQYLRGNEVITHRVISIYRDRGVTFFITKGDANNVPDDPVSEQIVLGKTLFTIPKVGWVSIFFRTAALNIFDFFARNLGIAYATITATAIASVLAVRSYRNQPLRRFRRRIAR
jgi:signal peptidase